jgi:hypothetical protein
MTLSHIMLISYIQMAGITLLLSSIQDTSIEIDPTLKHKLGI